MSVFKIIEIVQCPRALYLFILWLFILLKVKALIHEEVEKYFGLPEGSHFWNGIILWCLLCVPLA